VVVVVVAAAAVGDGGWRRRRRVVVVVVTDLLRALKKLFNAVQELVQKDLIVPYIHCEGGGVSAVRRLFEILEVSRSCCKFNKGATSTSTSTSTGREISKDKVIVS
jgi:hypothetical protein